MKTVKAIKKMVALGIGMGMVGATLFGASAVKLSDYPAPFVVNGVPASNLAIVVGDNSAGSDVIGAAEIVGALQAAAVVKTTVPGAAAPRVKLVGDSVEIGTPTDLLEINEAIGNVRETLTEFDLGILKGGTITTRRGVTKYNQYINFNRTETNSSLVKFGEDEFDNVGHFLFYRDGAQLFTWTLQFEEGLTSDLDSANETVDLRDREVNILGIPYTVTRTRVDTALNEVRMELMGGPVQLELGEGDKKTVTVNGKEYEIEILIIQETGTPEVLLRVNGETLPRLRKGEAEPLSDGTLIGVRDILATGKDTQSSLLRLYVGATRIELKDTEYIDDAYETSGATINNEAIEDALVRIKMTESADLRSVTVQSIDYVLLVDALIGDMFVPPGHGVREYLDEPEGMLAPYWDIRYEGLLDTGTTVIRLNPVGKDEYKLEFTNQEGLQYALPYVTNRGGTFKFGDDRRNLYWRENNAEGAAPGVFPINVNSYFILSQIDNTLGLENTSLHAAHNDNTAFTRVMKYESIDSSNSVLTFTDLAAGTKQVTFSRTINASNITSASFGTGNRSADLVVGGITYAVAVSGSEVGTSSNGNLTIDLNADGNFTNGTAVIATEGGALIILGDHNNLTNYPNIGGSGVNQTNLSIITLSKQFDESSSNEIILMSIEQRSSNRIGIAGNASGIRQVNATFHTVAGSLNMTFLTSEPEIAQGLTLYGTFLELFDPLTTDTPEELTVEYPLSQRGVQIFVTSGQITKEEIPGGYSEKVNPIQIGASKVASEVSDVKNFNALVIGGPCANPIAATLMGNPDPCWESVAENTAIIKLFTHTNGNVALLVAGRSALNTRQASRVLATKQDLSKLTGTEAKITGTSLTQISVSGV